MGQSDVPGIEYLARITCGCGATAECEMDVRLEMKGYVDYDLEYEHDNPDGWLGGYDKANPPMCPACVKIKYA